MTPDRDTDPRSGRQSKRRASGESPRHSHRELEEPAHSESTPRSDSRSGPRSDSRSGPRWEFWIDRGGTFTDCIGRAPDGSLHTHKRLSSDSAPAEAIRAILERETGLDRAAPLPECSVKLGSTVATNALLERRGVPTCLVANLGLGDVLRIGTQERPELFDLEIVKSPTLHSQVVELSGRVGVGGEPVEPLDADAALRALRAARERGARSAAICLIHAYAHPELERRIAELAREAGFDYVAVSHEVARELGLLARGETTAADAYLTPLLREHVARLARALPGSRLRFMQSSGGLTTAQRYRGPSALLSGPAGGVVAAARVAAGAGADCAIGFDMGGTSTDVSLIRDGQVERAFETLIGGVRVRAPMLRIHSVAAGGGSICRFDGFRLTVGPESAGAQPGPLCYGAHADDGSGELALTDVNFALGRILPDRFPFDLVRAPVDAALSRLEGQLAQAGLPMSVEEIAAGFVEVANASMAQAIQQVSVARGVDPRDCALVGFGGAAGQHVCAIARGLGIRRVLLHANAGLLSAYGIGLADLNWDRQRDAGRRPLGQGNAPLPAEVREDLCQLEREGRVALAEESDGAPVETERWLDLRYRGTDAPLSMREPEHGDWWKAFRSEHRRRFGYVRDDRAVEIVTARVRAVARTSEPHAEATRHPEQVDAPSGASGAHRRMRAWFADGGWADVPVLDRESLEAGREIEGPVILLEGSGTTVVDPGFRARMDERGLLELRDHARSTRRASVDLRRADPVRLEVFANRFMSIAEQMGSVLRDTSVSTNIKERLDYSCAVFDADGGLVANAPHIPVHLGAMAETVRAVRRRFPELAAGEVVATNDPAEGGSHLPDVTVVTPVFAAESHARGPSFFVASRGHHADLGGMTPGSMPPDSRTLEEEGVLIRPFRLVRDGRFDEARVRAILTGGRYPARRPDDNVADLIAMVAANRAGERLLVDFSSEQGVETVSGTMRQLQQAAADKVAREIGKLPDGEHRFEDRLDDGTPICVCLTVRGQRMRIDFAGSGPAVDGNLNAPPAVVRAAVIYVLRALVDERIPLNGGCLAPVEICIPEDSILSPPAGRAVVGGNVETSQRVVDVLLGALGLAAASQGTMNNLSYGDPSFGYYETIGGGAGAGPDFDGASGVHTHMTNTRITDAEVLEARYPVRLARFSLRRASGGGGRHSGGDGLIRHTLFLAPVTATLLTERRRTAPYGLKGGQPGSTGRNEVQRAGGRIEALPGRCRVELAAGDCLRVETPGGGGFGALRPARDPK